MTSRHFLEESVSNNWPQMNSDEHRSKKRPIGVYLCLSAAQYRFAGSLALERFRRGLINRRITDVQSLRTWAYGSERDPTSGLDQIGDYWGLNGKGRTRIGLTGR